MTHHEPNSDHITAALAMGDQQFAHGNTVVDALVHYVGTTDTDVPLEMWAVACHAIYEGIDNARHNGSDLETELYKVITVAGAAITRISQRHPAYRTRP